MNSCWKIFNSFVGTLTRRLQWLAYAALLPDLRFHDMTPEIARMAANFDASMPGNPGDRLIAATTLALKAKLVTSDTRLCAFP